MKNIHVLPTDIFNQIGVDHYGKTPTQIKIAEFLINKNIYITSDEEIKEGDFHLYENEIKKTTKETIDYIDSSGDEGFKKIILTTDQDLIKDGVQAIDDEFLEWFIKNPSCESVEVVYEPKNFLDTSQGWEYTIISKIPKEEPMNMKEEFEKSVNIIDDWLKKNGDPEIHKQEILEEVRVVKRTELYNSILSIVKQIPRKEVEGDAMDAPSCAYELQQLFLKWQAERMYSEEEVPTELESVLAKITHQNDLGLSQWHEVVYYDNDADKWCSYSGSKTFEDGERVVGWKYCKDLI